MNESIVILQTSVKEFKIKVLQTDDVFTVKEFKISNTSEYIAVNFNNLKDALSYVQERSLYILSSQ